MNEQSKTLIAANDNPGGSQTTRLPMAAFVTVMARAYVAETQVRAARA